MPKRGENIWKRKDGRWEARYIKGRKENGRALYGYVYARSYTEAKQKRQQILKELLLFEAGHSLVRPEQDTLRMSEVTEEFLLHKENIVKHSTLGCYTRIVTAHILPVMGEYPIAQITTPQLDAFGKHLLENGRRNGRGGLSPKTTSDILRLLRQIFNYAERRKYITPHLVEIIIPKVERNECRVLSPLQQKKLEATVLKADGDGYQLGVYLSLFTGIRIGELCGLRWSDIDFEAGILRVERTVQRVPVKEETDSKGPRTRLVIDTPKSKAARRIIPLAFAVAMQLKKNKGKDMLLDSYVLTGTRFFIEPRTYYERYKGYLRSCGLSGFTFHTLRHTFATRCIESGMDVKSLSEILGHAGVRMTLERYVHPSLDVKRNAMERLAAS